MRFIPVLLIINFIFTQGYNVQMLNFMSFAQETSDITGFEQDGREIAVVGLQNSAVIVDVTNPNNPFEIDRIPGSTSIWRDLKYWNRHIYIGTEADDGIKVVSVNDLDNPELVYTITDIDNSHNIHVDEGYLYIVGADVHDVWIYDLTNPGLPQLAGTWDTDYLHDIEVYNNKLYGAGIYTGYFYIIDVSDKSNPTTLAAYDTEGGYISTHDCAVTFDENYLITADESMGGHIRIWDIQNYDNISLVSEYITSIYHSSHNVYIQESTGLLIASYYADGTRFIDISDPYNPIEVGYYDTTDIEGVYVGNWGTYVDLPSSNVVSSDTESGLYILRYGGVSILHTPLNDQSNNENIEFQANIFSVASTINSAELHIIQAGIENPFNLELSDEDQYSVTLDIFGDSGVVEYYITASDLNGESSRYPQNGSLMFVYGVLENFIIEEFESTPTNWETNIIGDNATAGIWEWGDPNGTDWQEQIVQPEDDNTIIGNSCFITGNSTGQSVGTDDVDNGKTTLLSPIYDLNNQSEILLTYYSWYTNNLGDNPNSDHWSVDVSNDAGITWMTLEYSSTSNTSWLRKRFLLSQFIDLTSEIQFRFVAEDEFYEGDNGSGGSIVEAALDDFSLKLVDFYNCEPNGDINADLNWDILDIVLLINIILFDDPQSDENLCSGDLNQDGVINILDITILISFILEQ